MILLLLLAAGVIAAVPRLRESVRDWGRRSFSRGGLAECRLLEAALRSGVGPAVMDEIAHRLQSRCDEAIQARVSAVEPALVLVNSLLVGGVLLAVMLPLTQLMTSLG